MSDPRGALLIRLESARHGESVVLPCPADLRFDSEIPGGYKTLSCTATIPAGTATAAVTEALAAIRVIDRRTGATIWYGQLTDPGLLATTVEGQRFQLTAEGPKAALTSWREVYGLVDRDEESWQAVGDFTPASTSFGGDLSPSTDISLGDFTVGGDLNAVTDFGDQLAIDFPDLSGVGGLPTTPDLTTLTNVDIGSLTGSLDVGNVGNFGGDIGNIGSLTGDLSGLSGTLGTPSNIDIAVNGTPSVDLSGLPGNLGTPSNIQVAGPTYPSTASYPGYLGYLRDPLGGPGAMLPIPLGSGGWDKPFVSSGLMFTPGAFDSSSTYWTTSGDTGFTYTTSFAGVVQLGPGAAAEFWSWADAGFTTGYRGVITADGTISLYDGGTLLDTDSFPTSPDGVYQFTFRCYFPGYPLDWLMKSGVDGRMSWRNGGDGGTSLGVTVYGDHGWAWGAIWGPPDYRDGDGLMSNQYYFPDPGVNQPATYIMQNNRYWGVSKANSNDVTYREIHVNTQALIGRG